MKIFIFSPDLSNRKDLDSMISGQFEFKYNGIGKFTVVLPEDDYNISLAIINSIIYIKEYKVAYIVSEVEMDCDMQRIFLHGFSANNILNWRVLQKAYTVTNVESDVYSIVTDNLRGLDISCATTKNLPETITATEVYGDALLDGITGVLSAVNYGNRMNFDPAAKAFEWEIYSGEDKTSGIHSVAFVHERGNAPGLVIDKDQSDYKNVCYCEYQYKESDEKNILSVGTATGNDRREFFTTFSGDSQKDTESNEDFENRVKQFASLQLGNYRNRIGFDIAGDSSEYGTKYQLGDLVWCVSLKHHIKFSARITGVTLTQDSSGTKVSLVIGDSIKTIMG